MWKYLINFAQNAWIWTHSNALSKKTYNKSIDLVMRLPRPVAFFLICAMFVLGWNNPAIFLQYANALTALPEAFWAVVMLLLGSIAVDKFKRKDPPE